MDTAEVRVFTVIRITVQAPNNVLTPQDVRPTLFFWVTSFVCHDYSMFLSLLENMDPRQLMIQTALGINKLGIILCWLMSRHSVSCAPFDSYITSSFSASNTSGHKTIFTVREILLFMHTVSLYLNDSLFKFIMGRFVYTYIYTFMHLRKG